MDVGELLVETFGRIPPLAEEAVQGLSPDQLVQSVGEGANPIGWLVWHMARVQDHHVAELLGEQQIWVEGGWAQRFGLEPDPSNTGYGHDSAEVRAVRPDSAEALTSYLGAVAARTEDYLSGVGPSELDAVVDERWDPPVTLGVRLVSIADDSLQHAGQAAYVRGVITG
jgi:uncharacterized damage-inducible protein DinB